MPPGRLSYPGREIANRRIHRRDRPAPRRAPPDGPRRARAGRRRRCPSATRNAQSEDCSASSSRSARSLGRPARGQRPQLGGALAPRPARPRPGALHVRRSRPAPQLVGGTASGAASAAVVGVERLERAAPRRSHARDHGAQPVDALVPEVPEQLGVERDHRRAAARRRRARRSRSASARACSAARRAVVRRAVDRPRRGGCAR